MPSLQVEDENPRIASLHAVELADDARLVGVVALEQGAGGLVGPDHDELVLDRPMFVTTKRTLTAGAAVGHFGLQRIFETFGVVVAAIAPVVAGSAWLTRPTVANEESPLKEQTNPPSVHQVDVSW